MAETHDDLFKNMISKVALLQYYAKSTPPHDAEQLPEWPDGIDISLDTHGIFEVAPRHALIHSYTTFEIKCFRTNHREYKLANLGSLVTNLMSNCSYTKFRQSPMYIRPYNKIKRFIFKLLALKLVLSCGV